MLFFWNFIHCPSLFLCRHPATGRKSRERNLINKDRSRNAQGIRSPSPHQLEQPDLVSKDRSVVGSSTPRAADSTLLADAVETASLSLNQPDPDGRFDDLSSDSQREIPPTDEEKPRFVRIACVSPPLRNLAPSQMIPPAQDAVEPYGIFKLLCFLKIIIIII